MPQVCNKSNGQGDETVDDRGTGGVSTAIDKAEPDALSVQTRTNNCMDKDLGLLRFCRQ